MKLLAAVFLTVAALTAHAEVKAPGTVFPTRCARTVRSSAGKMEVCFASIIGMEGSYLTLNNDVWAIASGAAPVIKIEHVGTSGKRGMFQERLATDVRVGELKKLSVDVIEVKIRDQLVRASNFEPVIHTESL